MKKAKIIAAMTAIAIACAAIIVGMDRMLLLQREAILVSTCKELPGVKTPQEVEDLILKHNPDAEHVTFVHVAGTYYMHPDPRNEPRPESVMDLPDQQVTVNLLPQVEDEWHMVSSKLQFTMGKPHAEGGYIVGDEISDVSITETTNTEWWPPLMQSLHNHRMAISSATDCQIEFL